MFRNWHDPQSPFPLQPIVRRPKVRGPDAACACKSRALSFEPLTQPSLRGPTRLFLARRPNAQGQVIRLGLNLRSNVAVGGLAEKRGRMGLYLCPVGVGQRFRTASQGMQTSVVRHTCYFVGPLISSALDPHRSGHYDGDAHCSSHVVRSRPEPGAPLAMLGSST